MSAHPLQGSLAHKKKPPPPRTGLFLMSPQPSNLMSAHPLQGYLAHKKKPPPLLGVDYSKKK